MDEEMRLAWAAVVRDMDTTGVPAPRTEESTWQSWPTAQSLMLWSASGSGVGVWIDTAVSEAERIAMLADQVQEWMVEHLAVGGRSNWPQCPAHPETHPLVAAMVDGVAIWRCPKAGTAFQAVGALPPSGVL